MPRWLGAPPAQAQLLAMQRLAGNRATTELLRRPRVQRCGGEVHQGCACAAQTQPTGAAPAVPGQPAVDAESDEHGQRTPIQRKVGGDVKTKNINQEWVADLTDEELAGQIKIVREQLLAMPVDDMLRPGAMQNLRLLEADVSRRTAIQSLGNMPVKQSVPRPPGLPMDGGFALAEIPDLDPAALQQIPEGKVVEIDPSILRPAAGTAPPVGQGQPPGGSARLGGAMAGGGGGALAGGAANTAAFGSYGFAGGAEGYAIGIVVRPRSGVSGALGLDWGHTSLTLRRAGAPLDVVGFNPDMRTVNGLTELLMNSGKIKAGKYAAPGRITGDASMFNATDSIHIEYPIGKAQAAEMAAGWPKQGLTPELGYTARPAVYGAMPNQPCQGTNCGAWAVPKAEGPIGGPVRGGLNVDPATGAPISVIDVGKGGSKVPNTGHQPELMNLGQGKSGPIADVPGAVGKPVVSSMPKTLKVLRVGGKVLMVVGVAVSVAEVVTAKPEERGRTGASAAGGFVGGLALGAAAGLVCGPGAPVCSVVLGLGLGILGSLGGSAVAEAAYDSATAPPVSPAPEKTFGSTPCPSCHDRMPDSGPQLGGLTPFIGPPRALGDQVESVRSHNSPNIRKGTSIDDAVIKSWTSKP